MASDTVAPAFPLIVSSPLFTPLTSVADDLFERRLPREGDGDALHHCIFDSNRELTGMEEAGEEVQDCSSRESSRSRHGEVEGRLGVYAIFLFARKR